MEQILKPFLIYLNSLEIIESRWGWLDTFLLFGASCVFLMSLITLIVILLV